MNDRMLLFSAILLLSVCYYSIVGIVFPIDDAYIVSHNLDVLISGQDVNYVNSPSLSGSTSIFNIVIIYLISNLVNPLLSQFITMWLSIIFYAFGIYFLSMRYGLSSRLSIIVVLLGVLVGDMPMQLLNGLETGMALASIIWMLYFSKCKEKRTPYLILISLVPWIRPELIALSIILLIYEIYKITKSSRKLEKLIATTVVYIFVNMLFFCFLFFEAGYLLPDTVFVKKYWFAESSQDLWIRMARVFVNIMLFISKTSPLMLAVVFFRKSEFGITQLIFFFVFIIAYLQFPGALYQYEHRYAYVFIPFALLVLINLLASKEYSYKRIGVLILYGNFVLSLIMFPLIFNKHLKLIDFTNNELSLHALWVNENIPEGSLILVHDAGYISFATNFELIDMVGLKTPKCAEFHKEYTFPSGGELRGKAIHEISLHYNPDYLVVLNEWDQYFSITSGLKNYGWTLIPKRIWV